MAGVGKSMTISMFNSSDRMLRHFVQNYSREALQRVNVGWRAVHPITSIGLNHFAIMSWGTGWCR